MTNYENRYRCMCTYIYGGRLIKEDHHLGTYLFYINTIMFAFKSMLKYIITILNK